MLRRRFSVCRKTGAASASKFPKNLLSNTLWASALRPVAISVWLGALFVLVKGSFPASKLHSARYGSAQRFAFKSCQTDEVSIMSARIPSSM